MLEAQILRGFGSHLYNSLFRSRETESGVQRLKLTSFLKMSKSLKERLMIKTATNYSQPYVLSPLGTLKT
jgi:hypothetical protein